MFQKSVSVNETPCLVPKHLYFYFGALSGNLAVKEQLTQKSDCRALETLNLAHTNITDGIIDTLIELFFQEKGSSLKELNLSGNQFTDQGIEKLLTAIEQVQSNQLLKLSVTANPLSAPMFERVETIFKQRTATAKPPL